MQIFMLSSQSARPFHISAPLLHNFLAGMAIILYLGFLIGLISNFEELRQRDLNRKFYAQICKKTYFKTFYNKLINQVDFKEI